MTRALLFDLDGTLCLMDADSFTKAYLNEMAKSFSDVILEEQFLPSVMKSTMFCINHPSEHYSCYDVFLHHFCEGFGLDPQAIKDRMMQFYRNDFPKYGKMITKLPLTEDVIRSAKQKGFLLALASNSLMPQFSMAERIRWCGLDPHDFDFIPGVEFMHYAKPNPKYFQEIAKHLGVTDMNQCMMIGNSLEEDMVAADIGMQTFLIAEGPYIEDLEKVNYHGTLKDLLEMINEW
ncbi:MAG: HAD family hydrolase [Bacillota bacterium]|jgi:FMN phosphatase YigB (HAD superfamily)